MGYQLINALLIEDDPDDVLLLKESLSTVGMGKVKLDCADRLSRGLLQLGSKNYDLILLDLNLPDSRGLDTLTTTIKRFPRIPVVVLSGLADDAITVEAVRRGAQDYLVKGEISGPLLLRVMRYAIERKQVESVLRASEVKYRTLVETTPNSILLADLEGKILICNQHAARLHRYENSEMMQGVSIDKLIAPGDLKQAGGNFQKTIHEGKITNAQYNMLRKDGSQFTAEVSTAPIRSAAGNATGFIAISRDITEQKLAFETEKRLSILKEEFIASVSHDLRTPLLSMLAELDKVSNGKDEDGHLREELIKNLSRGANQLLDMVNELLDFLLLESDRFSLNYKRIDLIPILTASLQAHQELALAKQISLATTVFDPSLPVEADPQRMRVVFNNLIENAINFSNEGGKVLITGKSASGRVIINVVDEGCGISLEDCTRIFDKYYRVREETKKHPYGTGLGLYITKQIVIAHGGTISVNSQVGAGSTFTLMIPEARVK